MKKEVLVVGVAIALLSGLTSTPAVAQVQAETSGAKAPASGEYLLSDFGDVSTPADIKTTLAKAIESIQAKGGGTLIIPPTADRSVSIINDIQTVVPQNDPKPPVTIIDRRGGYENVLVPSIGKKTATGWNGLTVQRDLNFQGPGIGPWITSMAMGIENNVTHGTSSYLHMSDGVTSKGKDVRIYLRTERGIYVGQYLNYYTNGYGGNWEGITIKSIGWDKERKQYYATADLASDHTANSFLSNKSIASSLGINAWSNADSQTDGDIKLIRRHYANGDSFLYSGQYLYQSDILSQVGDEGGVIFNAEAQHDPSPFFSTVESVNPAQDEVVFAPGVSGAQKLASSRPLINMNPKKWITAGTVKIVGADEQSGVIIQNPAIDAAVAVEDGVDLRNFKYKFRSKPGEAEKLTITSWDGKPFRQFKYPYKGRAYPSLIHNGANWLGGRIIASAEAGPQVPAG